MKINGGKIPEGQEVYLRTEKTQGREATDQAGRTDQRKSIQDRVELSGKAKELDALKKAINELPEIREKKVEDIKKAIEAGTYRVDPYKVADRLLEEL